MDCGKSCHPGNLASRTRYAEEGLRERIGVTAKVDAGRHFILPVLATATRSAIVAAAGPVGCVIHGQGVERRPTLLMAPLRDFAEVFANVRFKLRQARLLAQVSVRDKIRFCAGAYFALKPANFSMVV